MTLCWIAKLFGQPSKLQRRSSRRKTVRLGFDELETRITPATQTWVSGVGDDANPGSRTAPDKTFTIALNNTDAGGTITALDPGSFGAVTINKSITIDGTGTLAAIGASGGINGITINAGATDVVVLRHLKLQGIGTGGKGIDIVSAGEVHIEDCVIQNFSGVGIDFEPTNAGAQLFIEKADLIDNAGGGILIKPNGVSATASIDGVHAFANLFGIRAEDGAQVSISNSVASGNTQIGYQTVSTASAVHVDLVNDITSNNGTNGVTSEGAAATVSYVALTAVGNSGQATSSVSSGVLTDLGNDDIADNGRGFTPIALAVGALSGGASRTWVSGVGDDANPDSRTAPGKTFAGTISKTSNGGEIDVLDPGGFGTFTITKSITVDGSGSFGSSIISGINGIVINAGAAQVVVLRGLSLDGTGQLGLAGIKVNQAGAVIVEDCIFKNLSGAAIDFEPTNDGAQLFVENCTFVDNLGGGILVKPNGASVTARASIDGVQAIANKFGVQDDNGADAAVSNSVASGNTQNGFQTVAGAAATVMNLQTDVASNNGANGVTSEGANATVSFANLTAVGNSGQGILSVTSGVLTPIGSNRLTDNAKAFTPIALVTGNGGAASRTWVSGVGDDANPCSRTAPGATFGSPTGALSKTAPGGEIDALDSGDFGTATITKSITLDGGSNLAGVQTTTAVNALTISAGATDVVILRHLRLDGFGIGLNGIKVTQAGAVILEDCVIEDFTGVGIDFEPTNAGAQLFVHNCQVINNAGGGVLLKPNGVAARASLDHVDALANKYGFRAEDNADVTISNSVASGSTQNGFQDISATIAAQMNLETDVSNNNGQNGLTAEGANAHVAMSNVTVTGNSGQGSVSVGGGSFLSFNNDRFADNVKGFTPISLALGSGGGANSRTWVSGVGDDVNNPPGRTAPGKTFAGVLPNTTVGGEIDQLDPGYFGPVTISHSIIIDGTGFAGIQASSGNAVTINAGPNDVVILRGLTLNGLSQTGANGILINGAGAVIVENCLIENFSNAGIDFAPTNAGAELFVSNTTLLGNGGYGVIIAPSGVAGLASLDHIDAEHNTVGVAAFDRADVSVSTSRAVGSANDGFEAGSTGASSVMTLESVLSANNSANGVQASGAPIGSATIYVSNVGVTGNLGRGLTAQLTTPAAYFIVSFGNVANVDNSGGNGAATSTLLQTDVLPAIGSPAATSVGSNSATLGANITNSGGPAILTSGAVYAVTTANANPTIGGASVTNLAGPAATGPFTVNATSLTPSTGYSFTAYATNRVGLIYTSPVSNFNTTVAGALPITDSFTQGPGTDLSGIWTEQVGDYDIDATQKANGDSPLNLATITGVSAANVVVQADVTFPVGMDTQVGLVARYSGSGDTANMYWGALVHVGSMTIAAIYRHNTTPDAWNALTSATVAGNPLGGKLRFEVVDTSLQLFLNNGLVASAVDAAPLPAGTLGMRSLINSKLDNFSGKAVFSDTFTQGNGTPINAANWTTQSGSFTVQSNAVTTGGGTNLATVTGLNEADVHLEADVTLLTNGLIGLVARNNGTDYYTGVLADSGGITYAMIFRHAAGGFSLLSSVTAVAGNPKSGKLRFDLTGTSLSMSMNGTTVSVTDAALASGSTGMLSIGGGNFDNFQEIPRA